MIEIKHLKTLQACGIAALWQARRRPAPPDPIRLVPQFSDLEQRLGFVCLYVKVSRCALLRRERSCCSWPIRSCRKSAAPCRIAMSRSKPAAYRHRMP